MDDMQIEEDDGQHPVGGITGLESMTLADEGHFLLGHHDEIRARIKISLAESRDSGFHDSGRERRPTLG